MSFVHGARFRVQEFRGFSAPYQKCSTDFLSNPLICLRRTANSAQVGLNHPPASSCQSQRLMWRMSLASGLRASKPCLFCFRKGPNDRCVPPLARRRGRPRPAARTRGRRRAGRRNIPSPCANCLKTLKTAMGGPCNELAWIWIWRPIRLASAPRLFGPPDASYRGRQPRGRGRASRQDDQGEADRFGQPVALLIHRCSSPVVRDARARERASARGHMRGRPCCPSPAPERRRTSRGRVARPGPVFETRPPSRLAAVNGSSRGSPPQAAWRSPRRAAMRPRALLEGQQR